MPRRNYRSHSINCPSCGALNICETPIVPIEFEGKLPPIRANNRRLGPGERSFPCRSCGYRIEILD